MSFFSFQKSTTQQVKDGTNLEDTKPYDTDPLNTMVLATSTDAVSQMEEEINEE